MNYYYIPFELARLERPDFRNIIDYSLSHKANVKRIKKARKGRK